MAEEDGVTISLIHSLFPVFDIKKTRKEVLYSSRKQQSSDLHFTANDIFI
jgi:hypothetical protein